VQPQPALRPRDPTPILLHFTARQFQIIELVSQGMKNREIAPHVGTTEQVIKNYLRVIYDKTGMEDRLNLALWWHAKKPQYLAAGVIAE
jgi:DNA-binding NarL/FixJ family response regulator